MITKLPRWVESGAFLLAMIAGIINAVGLLGFQHQSVSHLSGTVTLLGTQLLPFDAQSLHLLMIIVSFLAGATFSGVLIERTALKLGRRYGVALLVESALLVAATVALTQGYGGGHYLASAACGLQNAMISTYSGAVIRTTHMTGIITDLGLMLGARIRGEEWDKRKAWLFGLIFLGFLFGGFGGSLLYSHLQFSTLLIPAALAFVVAMSYWIYLFRLDTAGRSID